MLLVGDCQQQAQKGVLVPPLSIHQLPPLSYTLHDMWLTCKSDCKASNYTRTHSFDKLQEMYITTKW